MNANAQKAILGTLVFGLALVAAIQLFSTRDLKPAPAPLAIDQVLATTVSDLRLADSVPLEVGLVIRWKITDPKAFARNFPDAGTYAQQVLAPKAKEALSMVAHRHASVAQVFGPEREAFVTLAKTEVAKALADPEVTLRSIVVSDLRFPETFTVALEKAALLPQELEAVKHQGELATERARMDQKQAEAEGKVTIARAEAEGKVAEIAARTEEKNRTITLARAETEAQVVARKAKAEAAKQKVMAEVEADRLRLLADVEAEKQTKLRKVEVDHKRAEKDVDVEREKALAELCGDNPAYASFLVSKELASKVQIAVLPTGSDPGTIGNLLQAMTPVKTAQVRENRKH